jgi:UMF1 family MFS transporter
VLGPTGRPTLITAVLMVQEPAVALGMGRLARTYEAKRTIFTSLVAWTPALAAGFFLPVAFFPIGFALLARVPVRRAIREAGNPVPDRI